MFCLNGRGDAERQAGIKRFKAFKAFYTSTVGYCQLEMILLASLVIHWRMMFDFIMINAATKRCTDLQRQREEQAFRYKHSELSVSECSVRQNKEAV